MDLDEIKKKVCEDINLGIPYREIAKRYGISKSTVGRIKAKYMPNVVSKLTKTKYVKNSPKTNSNMKIVLGHDGNFPTVTIIFTCNKNCCGVTK